MHPLSTTSNDLIAIARRSAAGESNADIAAALHVSEEWIELVKSSDGYAFIAHDLVTRATGQRTAAYPSDGGVAQSLDPSDGE